MNIGILTHPLINNYGGILQNFALQKVLLSLGHNVKTIDIHLFPKISFPRMVVGWMNRLRLHYINGERVPISINPMPSKKQFAVINEHTLEFVNSNIELTRRIYQFEDLQSIDEEYRFDAYIIGSDQVWNPSFCPWYFGSFVRRKDVKLFAYAASFGHSEWKMNRDLTVRCATLAKNFNAISVREDSAVDLCRDYLNVEVDHIIDPTLLLDKDVYLSVINVSAKSKNLFSYILDNDSYKQQIVNCISEKKRLAIETCMPKEKYIRGLSNIENCIFPSIDKWLNCYSNAQFVVTDSFHGTAFSIIFNLPFVVIGNRRRGYARFESILRTFGLENRLVTSLDQALSVADLPIDYARVNRILADERRKGLNFLSDLL